MATVCYFCFFHRKLNTCDNFLFKFQKSAQFLRKELPIRIARRVVDFQKLPHIVLCNPVIHDVVGKITMKWTNATHLMHKLIFWITEKSIHDLKCIQCTHCTVMGIATCMYKNTFSCEKMSKITENKTKNK